MPYLDELGHGLDVSLCEEDMANVTANPVQRCFAKTTDVDAFGMLGINGKSGKGEGRDFEEFQCGIRCDLLIYRFW